MLFRGSGCENHPQITQSGLGPVLAPLFTSRFRKPRLCTSRLRKPRLCTSRLRKPRLCTSRLRKPRLCPSRLRNLWMVLVVVVLYATTLSAQTKRVVIVKCDGLPYDLVDRFVKQRDSSTGKSALPWIDYIFYQRGSRLSNFYVRGMSLSAPSWSLLETGQHLQIKGNVEFDRYTLHS